MNHKCQSSLVRCALRGQHPKPVVYPFMAVWCIVGAFRTDGPQALLPRAAYDLGPVMDAAAGGRINDPGLIAREVPR